MEEERQKMLQKQAEKTLVAACATPEGQKILEEAYAANRESEARHEAMVREMEQTNRERKEKERDEAMEKIVKEALERADERARKEEEMQNNARDLQTKVNKEWLENEVEKY